MRRMFPDPNVVNFLQKSIINPRFPWYSHLVFPDPTCLLLGHKTDTLQVSSNTALSLTLSYIAEVMDEHIQISGLKFMQLVGS